MSNWFKRNGIHLAITVIFFAICLFYFSPAFQGKALGQSDVIGAQSTQKEIMDYRAKDTTILWTDQILGGMPTYQVWAPYSHNIANYAVDAVAKLFPNPVGIILMLMLGSYFLFIVLRLNPWLAAAGALAFTFSSYNIIYVVVGHVNQEIAIAFFAPILASVILILRGRHWTGFALLALFLAAEIKANHIQMTYYLMIALLILMVFELVNAIRTKQTQQFFKALAYMAGALVLALMVNASVLWSTYEYGKDSIRGKSNLTAGVKEASSGVPKEYAYEFSEGVGESLTLLVPNLYGGATAGPANPDSHVVKALEDLKQTPEQSQAIAQQFPMYWGEKPFTEGPWYFGIPILFLFVLGLFIVKNRIKWWLLATVVLTLLLSFGKNFTLISDLFFNYFPLYNKFRVVESILTVTSLCFPILALLAVDEIIKSADKKSLVKKLFITLYIVGGVTVILAAVPDMFFSFRPSNHLEFVQRLTQATGGDSGAANSIANALVQDRISAARTDALRTLLFVALTFALLWAYLTQRLKNTVAFSVLFLIVVVADLFTIDKRYLKDEYFVDKQQVQPPAPRPVDEFIMKDTDPDFRVFDTSQGINTDRTTPFFYKSIGGYSAARMKRYQELIENQLSASINHDVLDMLNTKYIIVQDQKTGNLSMQRNETACGHAWFVKEIEYAKNADDEMKKITAFSPKDKAIVDQQYKSLIDGKSLAIDPAATITLAKYTPDHLTYKSSSATNAVAVFSEIYYNKGWKMYIDGKESPYFRADYLLRAAVIPVGNHTITFDFHPASYYTGETISLAGSVLLVLSLGGAIFMSFRHKKEEEKKEA
ncbi:MAG: YfhO family protein [Bacteroidetes bacterium]|nr:YfhO family protein [Bacteroidota bacterium]